MSFIQKYIEAHPEVIVLDPLSNVRKLLDRYRQYKLIDDSELAREGRNCFFLFVPNELNAIYLNVSECD